MRVVPIALQTNIDTGSPSLAFGMRIERIDGQMFAFGTMDRPKMIDTDTTFLPGLNVMSIVQSAGFGVDNTEIEVIPDADITRESINAGRWDAATFSLSMFNWKAPTAGELIIMSGTIGTMKPRNGTFVAELRDLRQALQQDTTDVVQPDCRYRLGDAKCTVDLSDHLFTVTGSITSVTSRYVFADTARFEPDDYFAAGEIRFDTGLNAGLRFLVSDYASDTFMLALATPFAVTAGDAYTAIVGCRKRFEEDCRDKFDNGINHGGEPHKARIDKLLAGAA